MNSQGAWLTSYVVSLLFMVSAVILFSAKTEQARIVTIQKPILITQERKTPAYFAYQQSLTLAKKSYSKSLDKTTYLGNYSVQPRAPHYQLAEMKFTKTEYAQLFNSQFQTRTIASDLNDEMKNLAYEKVVFNQNSEATLFEQHEEVQALSPSRKWATIHGKFELRDGVGIVDHLIEIKRIEEGLAREVGKINLRAGTYSIDIESPNGYLIAQIKDKTGFIVGEDRQRLVNLQNKGSFFEGPFIRVGRPETLAANPELPKLPMPSSTLAANLKTGSSQTSTTVAVSIFDNQKTLSYPNEEFLNISKFSSSITRLYDPSQVYANITTIRQTGDKSPTPMFTQKWLQNTLAKISSQEQFANNSKNVSVVLGKFLINGVAASGAQAQIESLPGVKPIYFDQFMMPSLTLNETSSNGYFMFIGLEENTYNVVTMLRNKLVGSQLFVAELDSISFQNISTLSVPSTIIVRVFDAFTSEPVDSSIVASHQEEALQTNGGTLAIRSNVENNVTEFIAQPENIGYLPARYTQNGNKEYAHIALIREDWINEIKNIKLINDNANTGIIVGFTPDLNYQAYLVLDNYSKNNIVYFSKNGQLSKGPESGGGFILFNVPEGAREVVLQDSKTDRIFSQVFNVKDQQISTAHFSN